MTNTDTLKLRVFIKGELIAAFCAQDEAVEYAKGVAPRIISDDPKTYSGVVSVFNNERCVFTV